MRREIFQKLQFYQSFKRVDTFKSFNTYFIFLFITIVVHI